jgi:hypothetical protein
LWRPIVRHSLSMAQNTLYVKRTLRGQRSCIGYLGYLF